MPLRDGQCDECGFHELAEPGVAARHRHYHGEWRDGAEVADEPTDSVVASLILPAGVVEILEVTPDSPTVQQQRAAAVISAANRHHLDYDGPQYEAHETDYYRSVPAHQTRVYIARVKGRGAGFVLLRRQHTRWEGTWAGVEVKRNPAVPTAETVRWCIDIVWVRQTLQRNGVASTLVRTAAARLGIEPHEFAWGHPLSDAGKALARRLSPDIVRFA